MNIRTYSELSRLKTFDERFDYLNLIGYVGQETFGIDRYLNQKFYKSQEWKSIRDKVIIRDNGCDLGLDGYYIPKNIIIHHMNPITMDDLANNMELVCNPEYLICVSFATHNAIHYGDKQYLNKTIVERRPGDTCLWKRN